MPQMIWKFVDSPVLTPATLFDMNNWASGCTIEIGDDGSKFDISPPELRKVRIANTLTDGSLNGAASFENRFLTFTVGIGPGTKAQKTIILNNLQAELYKPRNLIMYQPDSTRPPVFFRTYRSDDIRVRNQGSGIPEIWFVDCVVEAEPFAIGTRIDIPQVSISNDPATPGPILNANTSFEVDASNWTGIGGTLTRTTAQFHAGVASGTITPDGVTATVRMDNANVAVTGGGTYRAQGWVRNAVARSIALNVNWYDASSVYITTSSGSVSVLANTWTFISNDFTAPSNAAFGNIIPTMTGTPAATNILWVDEVEIHRLSLSGSGYWDIVGIVGDVPTPAFVKISDLGSQGKAWLATRAFNNPAGLTHFVQAEAATLGTDTTVVADTAASGNSRTNTSFATNAGMVTRLTMTLPNGSDPAALRGRYRVIMRATAATAAINISMRWRQSGGGDFVPGPIVNVDLTPPNWKYYDMGIIEFPAPQMLPDYAGYSGLNTQHAATPLAIEVQRNSGTGVLLVDWIMILPATERLCSIFQQAANASGWICLDGPNDATYGLASGSTPFGTTRILDNKQGIVTRQGGLPMLVPGPTNRWYFIHNESSNNATETVDISYWPRWKEVASV